MRMFSLLWAAAIVLSGCRSAPVTYYTLTPGDQAGSVGYGGGGRPVVKAVLVLRPFPMGIDTTQILIRTDDARLRVEESGRWVAPFGEEVTGALVDALRRQYGIVVLESARHGDGVVPRIDLTVRKFDAVEGSSVTLVVDWTVANPAHEQGGALSCQSAFTERAGATVDGVVAAGQAAVLRLARVVGAAIEASASGATPVCQ